MSPTVVRSLMGVAGLGIVSAGSYGIYYVSKNTSNATNIKEQLIYEKLKIISFEEGDRLWKAKAAAYKASSSDKKISGVEISSYATDFTKLRDACKELLEFNLKDADSQTKLAQARQWCVDTGIMEAGAPPYPT